MSIRIVPKEQLGKEPSEKSISFIPPVLFPNLKTSTNVVPNVFKH